MLQELQHTGVSWYPYVLFTYQDLKCKICKHHYYVKFMYFIKILMH